MGRGHEGHWAGRGATSVTHWVAEGHPGPRAQDAGAWRGLEQGLAAEETQGQRVQGLPQATQLLRRGRGARAGEVVKGPSAQDTGTWKCPAQ